MWTSNCSKKSFAVIFLEAGNVGCQWWHAKTNLYTLPGKCWMAVSCWATAGQSSKVWDVSLWPHHAFAKDTTKRIRTVGLHGASLSMFVTAQCEAPGQFWVHHCVQGVQPGLAAIHKEEHSPDGGCGANLDTSPLVRCCPGAHRNTRWQVYTLGHGYGLL